MLSFILGCVHRYEPLLGLVQRNELDARCVLCKPFQGLRRSYKKAFQSICIFQCHDSCVADIAEASASVS